MWHAKKPSSDDFLLLGEVAIIKHTETTENADQEYRQTLGAEIANHTLLPDSRQAVTSTQIFNLMQNLKKHNFNAPGMRNVKLNRYQPKRKLATNELAEEVLIGELFQKMATTTFQCAINGKNEKENRFLELISVDLKEAKVIEKKTRFQSKSPFWFKCRKHRATASMIRALISKKARTPAIKRFRAKRKFVQCASVNHGMKFEEKALLQFRKKFSENTKKAVESYSSVGLLVNPNFPFCGASPDQIVKIEGVLYLVETKCPFNPYMRKKKLKFKFREENFYVNYGQDGKPFLKRSHDYFYQVQLQLFVANLESAFFVMYVPPDDLEYFLIKRDDVFLAEVLSDLKAVYQEHLLPCFTAEVFKDK